MPRQIETVPTHASGRPTQVQATAAKEVGHRSFPGKKVKNPKAPWNVVWCHEHCHKGSKVGVARSLHEVVKDVGASMVLLKKADRYMTWLEAQHSRPHVLITNWREVKPTVQSLAEAGSCRRRAASIIVLAESDVVYHRAFEWTKSLHNVRIEVLLETAIEPLRALLASFNKEVFHEEIQLMPQAEIQIQQMPLSRKSFQPLATSPPMSMPLARNGAKQMQKTPEVDFLPMTTVKPRCMDKLEDPCEKEESTAAPARTVVQQRHPGMNPGSLLAFLTEAVKHQHTAGRIHQDLLQNMPEVYED